MDDRVWSALLTRFADEDDIELAYNTVRTFFAGPVAISQADDEPDVSPDSEPGS